MQKKSLIKQKILQFLEYKGISKYRFYKETGITRGVLDQNNGMSEDNTSKFLACYYEVNPSWLLTGEGSMLKDKSSLPKTKAPDYRTDTNIPKDISIEKAMEAKTLKLEVDSLREQLKLKDEIIYLLKSQIPDNKNFLGSGFTV